MSSEKEMMTEYRAVFSYPSSILGLTRDTYGPERKSEEATKTDYCYRSEETRGWRSGTQTRQVSDWEDHSTPEQLKGEN
jgi:hypothetical protein